jgi:hypothetical protein
VRQWKLSPRWTSPRSTSWDAYTEAKEAMFFYTDTKPTRPGRSIKSNDKKRARLEAMRHVLGLFDYPGKDTGVASPPDRLIVGPAAEMFEQDEGPNRFPPLTDKHH